jgi:glutamine amidotransferase
MFMHNGYVGGWPRLRRRVEGLIPDEIYPSRVGTTDSEALFLAIIGAGIDSDPVGATADILATLRGMLTEGSNHDALRFTSAFTNGRDLYAFRFSVNDDSNTLYYRAAADRGLVVVSEPLDRNREDWTPVPPNHVLIGRAGESPQLLPFLQDK